MSDKNKVLIVDDESIVRDSLEAWLAEEGFDVCSAKNGIEALEILKNQNIDIGVFDIKMPGMDGITLMKKVLQLNLNFPIIIMTAHATVESAVKCMQYGAYDYIIKPFPPEKLSNLLIKILEHRQLENEHKRLQQECELTKLQLDRVEKLMNSGKYAIEIAKDLEDFLARLNTITDNIKMDLKNHIKYDNVINKIDELAKETIQFKRTAGEVAAIVQELEPNTKDISLNNVLENAVEAAQRYSKLKSTQINLNLEDNLPKIEGRYWSLVHAFTNIIVNAAQAISDKGFITLSTFKTTDARICCKISDTGRGIKKEYLPKLFDPFYSGWQEKKRIGLGLAVTQRIIKHFGGEVKVESEENKGSEFTICLPYV